MATFAAARNLAHNPRPVSTANTSVSGAGTRAFVTDRSYSGTGSLFVTLPAGTYFDWYAAGNDDADVAAIAAGSIVNVAVHCNGVNGNGVVAQAIITYTDSSATFGGVIPVSPSGNAFDRISLGGVTTTSGKTVRNVLVRIQNNAGVTRTFYVGGLDIRDDQAIDGFIHGDAGPAYSWEGIANNSPSNRTAVTVDHVVGQGGQVRPSITLELCDRRGVTIEDVTGHFIDGSVTYDMDADRHKGSLSVTLDDPYIIQALGDQYLRPVLNIERLGRDDDESGSLGMFMVDPPSERWLSGSNDQWSYSGRDMLALLDTWMLRQTAVGSTFIYATNAGGSPDPKEYFSSPDYVAAEGWTLAAGTSAQDAVIKLLQEMVGLDRKQFAIAVPGTIAAGLSWQNNETALKALTDILTSMGYQKPWVSPNGVIMSAIAGDDPNTYEPAFTFRTGEDSQVRWPFEVDPDVSKVGNRVRCTSTLVNTGYTYSIGPATAPTTADDPAYPPPAPNNRKGKAYKKWYAQYGDVDPNANDNRIPVPGVDGVVTQNPYTYWSPVEAIAENLDPAHPLSMPRLGRYIDLPDVSIPSLGTTDAAMLAAREALVKASRIPMKARLTTEVMLLGLNQVYLLDLMDLNGDPIPSGQGKYFCRGWTMQLGAPWQITHSLTRVIDYEMASWK